MRIRLPSLQPSVNDHGVVVVGVVGIIRHRQLSCFDFRSKLMPKGQTVRREGAHFGGRVGAEPSLAATGSFPVRVFVRASPVESLNGLQRVSRNDRDP